MAWLSFHVPSDVVPGRMVLCVTTLLTLTAMFNSVRFVKTFLFCESYGDMGCQVSNKGLQNVKKNDKKISL